MKSGVRAVGVAESYRGDSSTLAGAVVRADRVVDGLSFSSCTVGATDATAAVIDLLEGLDRPDVRYVLLGAVAPAWYNVLDLGAIYEAADRPTLAVTFEESEGLEAGIREAFSGPELEDRLERYRALPPRRELTADGERLYVRGVGLERREAETVVRSFTPEGGRPEPLRVARLAARAGDAYRHAVGGPRD
ncbi:DUF99 family protein [Natrononativus amylolyticus]|uniref:endonuclease dU n=1 Tax=Natrononativus amylolyticus TaxID=2963434 RepID=UPI0020CF50E8|nr:DUF99 family protein [Natrononativus amylolyticus]